MGEATPEVEALADVWASIDGRADRFWACKADRNAEQTEGYYAGYTAEAAEMIKRLRTRGFVVRPFAPGEIAANEEQRLS